MHINRHEAEGVASGAVTEQSSAEPSEICLASRRNSEEHLQVIAPGDHVIEALWDVKTRLTRHSYIVV
jgi:hypothetical protein